MSSKYDFVKVKVRIEEHYYVLSRYLLSRMLTFSEIPHELATKIALGVKKALVDSSTLEPTQTELQEVLFRAMADHGFGGRHVKLFRLMTQFYTERVPLVILIAGSGCSGKSTIAHQLGSKLNNHNIVDVEVLLDAIVAIEECAAVDVPSSRDAHTGAGNMQHPLWFLDKSIDDNAVVEEWLRRCAIVARAVAGDVMKALREGKVLILEGAFLDLSLFTALAREAEQMGGIFVPCLVEPPLPDRHGLMVEKWLSSRHHFAPHLSIPELHTLANRRFAAVQAALEDRSDNAMFCCTSNSGSRAVSPSSSVRATSISLPDPQDLVAAHPHRTRFDPYVSSRAANDTHKVLLDRIMDRLRISDDTAGSSDGSSFAASEQGSPSALMHPVGASE